MRCTSKSEIERWRYSFLSRIFLLLITAGLVGCIDLDASTTLSGELFIFSTSIRLNSSQRTVSNSAALKYEIIFSDPVAPGSFTAADVFNLGTATGLVWKEPLDLTGSGQIFALETSEIQGEGTVIPFIPAGAVLSANGQKNRESQANGPISIMFDRTAPTIPQDFSILNAETDFDWSSRSPSFIWTPSLDEQSGLKKYEAQVFQVSDNRLVVDWEPIHIATGFLSTNAFNYGLEYIIKMRAVDHAGNVSATLDGPTWRAQPKSSFRIHSREDEAHLGEELALSEEWMAISVYKSKAEDLSLNKVVVLLKKSGSDWIRTQEIADDEVGLTDIRMAISGNRLVMAFRRDYGAHPIGVKIFSLDEENSTWIQAGLIDGPAGVNIYGSLPEIGWVEDKIAAAIPDCLLDEESEIIGGCVFIYGNDGSQWFNETVLKPSPDEKIIGSYGVRMTAQGHRVALGGVSVGAIYTWSLDGGLWEFDGKISYPDDKEFMINNYFSLYGDRLAIVRDNNDLAIYRFAAESAWSEEAILLVPNEGAENYSFGSSLALYGDTLIVPNSSNHGRASIFQRVGDSWSLKKNYIPPDGHENDDFGSNIAINSTHFSCSSRSWWPRLLLNTNTRYPHGAAYYEPY